MSYLDDEQRFWDDRVRSQDRYSAIGRRTLPRAFNQRRKEALFPVIDHALARAGVDPGSIRLLDGGCGTGIYSEHYAARGAQVVGVDLSAEALRAIRRHGIAGQFCAAGLDRLPFPDRAFDLTHVFSVLYHIVDDDTWRSALTELSRVTRPGGLLILRIEWVERTTRVADHVKHRSRTEYLDLLEGEKGFTLEATYPFRDVVPLQPLVALFHRVLPSALSEAMARFANRFDLLRENRSQRLVVFRAPR